MVRQDKVLFQLERNSLTQWEDSQNTAVGRCSGLPWDSHRAAGAGIRIGHRCRLASAEVGRRDPERPSGALSAGASPEDHP